MGLSIITPHLNDFNGLNHIYECLHNQTDPIWEWIIVDDFSEKRIRLKVDEWIESIGDQRIFYIKNEKKSNASVCRNQGADRANYDKLIFLDADDHISSKFVIHRDINFKEFAIFKNTAVVDKNGTQYRRPNINDNYLNSFLKTKFVWQTSAILWDKTFFSSIGKFDPNLERLQDVELTIRALFLGVDYKVVDNEIDFYYKTQPIRLKKDIVKKSCASVNYIISKIDTNYTLGSHRKYLMKSYYFSCTKVLHRSKNKDNIVYVRESLKVFLRKKIISYFKYSIGNILLDLYKYKIISDAFFIKTNRYFFKV